jgi:hypothetical protein
MMFFYGVVVVYCRPLTLLFFLAAVGPCERYQQRAEEEERFIRQEVITNTIRQQFVYLYCLFILPMRFSLSLPPSAHKLHADTKKRWH